ncbi:hypothetical protein [Heliorestis convoluta]|uniref:Uncharacterized protein n=1 Tax=Heliorestis convoluta TaxID=356322 RepID=A0A5Q2N1F5_9FIRM|nr:hypothetical protein [Heliorestis convoluta]QGG47649.1 hypothetical protein FTV88_1549 [Heliorestis convoluta]
MTYDVVEADRYFTEQVLHNEEWFAVTLEIRQRALQNAANQLYRSFRRYHREQRPLPIEAIYEQALWLLRMDETIRKSEQGVKTVSVSGLSISMDKAKAISPDVFAIIGRKVGRYI